MPREPRRGDGSVLRYSADPDNPYRVRIEERLTRFMVNLSASELENQERADRTWVLFSIGYASGYSVCELCGHNPIRRLYFVKNRTNQQILCIGSECARNLVTVDLVEAYERTMRRHQGRDRRVRQREQSLARIREVRAARERQRASEAVQNAGRTLEDLTEGLRNAQASASVFADAVRSVNEVVADLTQQQREQARWMLSRNVISYVNQIPGRTRLAQRLVSIRDTWERGTTLTRTQERFLYNVYGETERWLGSQIGLAGMGYFTGEQITDFEQRLRDGLRAYELNNEEGRMEPRCGTLMLQAQRAYATGEVVRSETGSPLGVAMQAVSAGEQVQIAITEPAQAEQYHRGGLRWPQEEVVVQEGVIRNLDGEEIHVRVFGAGGGGGNSADHCEHLINNGYYAVLPSRDNPEDWLPVYYKIHTVQSPASPLFLKRIIKRKMNDGRYLGFGTIDRDGNLELWQNHQHHAERPYVHVAKNLLTSLLGYPHRQPTGTGSIMVTYTEDDTDGEWDGGLCGYDYRIICTICNANLGRQDIDREGLCPACRLNYRHSDEWRAARRHLVTAQQSSHLLEADSVVDYLNAPIGDDASAGALEQALGRLGVTGRPAPAEAPQPRTAAVTRQRRASTTRPMASPEGLPLSDNGTGWVK